MKKRLVIAAFLLFQLFATTSVAASSEQSKGRPGVLETIGISEVSNVVTSGIKSVWEGLTGFFSNLFDGDQVDGPTQTVTVAPQKTATTTISTTKTVIQKMVPTVTNNVVYVTGNPVAPRSYTQAEIDARFTALQNDINHKFDVAMGSIDHHSDSIGYPIYTSTGGTTFDVSSITSLTLNSLTVSGTGTTTFGGGIETTALNVTSTTASSTFANGINLSAGCFAVAGTCIGGGGASVSGGTAGMLTSWINGTTLTATGTPFAASYFASSTTATSTFLGGFTAGGSTGLTVLQSGSVGIGTTSPYAKLSVVGQIVGAYFTGTTTATSTFGGNLAINGTGTTTSAGGFDLSGGCFAVAGVCLSSGSSSNYPFALSGNATSTLTQFNGGLTAFASSTIGSGAQIGGLTISGGATTTGNAYFAGNVGIGTTSPYASLSVVGLVAAEYINATSTTKTSTFGGNITVGSLATSTFDSSVTIGSRVYAPNTSRNLAFGFNNSSGSYIIANGTGSFGFGSNLTAGSVASILSSGSGSFAGGRTIGISSTASISASNDGAFAFGSAEDKLITASGKGSLALGYATNGNILSSGSASFAFGNNVNATADLAIAFGSGYTNSTASTFQVGFSSLPTLTVNANALGVGSTTPWANLAINPTAGSASNQFVVGSSTATNFIIKNSGQIGVGTTSPWAKLSIDANNLGTAPSFVVGSSTATSFLINNSGNIGIGLTSIDADAKLHIRSDVSGGRATNLRLTNAGAGDNTAASVGFNYGNSANSPSFISSPYILGGTLAFGTGGGGAAANADGTIRMFIDANGGVVVGRTNLTVQALSTFEVNGGVAIGSYSGVSAAPTNGLIVSGNTGIGTSSPWAKLSVSGINGVTSPLFALSTSTASATTTAFLIDSNGKVGIGTTSPYAQLSVTGTAVAANFTADSLTATSTFLGGLAANNGGIVSDFSTGVTSISNLEIGSLTFDTDAGMVGWADLPVTSNATAGTIESYTAQLDGLAILTVYSESDGIGGIRKAAVGIGTTSPYAKFSIFASTSTDPTTLFAIGSSTAAYATSTFFTVNNQGIVGIGTTSAYATLSLNTTAGTDPFAVGSSTGNYFRINKVGEIAIGTTTAGCLQTSGSGVVFSATCATGSGTVNSGTTNRLSYYTGATTLDSANFLTVDTTNGRLGIGTSTPWSKLSVAGSDTTATLLGVDALTGFIGNFFDFKLASTTLAILNSSGSFGLGSSTPWGKFSISGINGITTPLFAISTSTASATNTAFMIDSNGKVGIGTTSPYAQLSVTGSVAAQYFNADSLSATSTFVGGINANNGTFVSDFSTGITSIGGLELGNLSFDTDAGVVSWADLPVTSASASGAIQSYTGNIAGLPLFTLYSEADGIGGIRKAAVGVGTTSPYAKFSIFASTSTDPQTLFAIGSSTAAYATSTFFTVSNQGLVGVGTTTPWATLAVNPVAGAAANQFVVGSSTATSFLINNSGFVGVGTTSPWAYVSINPNALPSGTPLFAVGSSTASKFLINDKGQSLFGTVSPVNSLVIAHFSGDTYTSGNMLVNGAILGTNSVNIRGQSNAAVTIQGVGSSGDTMIGTGGGNLGVGTSTPWSKLSIAGSATTGNLLGIDALTGFTGTFFDFKLASTTLAVLNSSGSFGLGSSTPWGKFAISGINGITTPLFALSTSTASATSTAFLIDSNGKVGIGTTSPYAQLSVTGTIAAQKFNADSASATSTFAGGFVANNSGIISDFSTGITSISNLEVGSFTFDADAGVVSWADMPVTSASTAGTLETYYAAIDGLPLLNLYSESDGIGGIRKAAVGIGTSSPFAKLSVFASTSTDPQTLFAIGSSTAAYATSTFFTVSNQGVVGIGTTTPWATLALNPVAGAAANQFVIGSSTATNFIVTNGGFVGVGTTSPWRKLSVTGTVAFDGLTSSATGNAVCITATKDITDAGAASCAGSSERFKENIVTLSPGKAIDTLKKLRVTSFDYRKDFYSPEESNGSYGLIAEEVEHVDPLLVDYGYDGKPLTLHFERLTGLTIQAIQELDLRVTTLEALMGSSTASSSSFVDTILSWFADKIVTAKELVTGTLHVNDKICADDVCITKDQFKNLLIQAGGSSSGDNSGNNSGGTGGGNTSTTTQGGGTSTTTPTGGDSGGTSTTTPSGGGTGTTTPSGGSSNPPEDLTPPPSDPSPSEGGSNNPPPQDPAPSGGESVN